MADLVIKYLPTDDLIPYANNPRRNDTAVDKVANSIKEFGFRVPIVVDADNVIVAGHTRLKAAKKLGLKWVKTRPYQVFFSSYDISDKSFERIKVKEVCSLMGATTNAKKVTEYLYSNRPIER